MKKNVAEIVLKTMLAWLFVCLVTYSLICVTKGGTLVEGQYSYTLDSLEYRGEVQKVWKVAVDKNGEYEMAMKVDTDSPAVVTAYQLCSESGTVKDYEIGVNLQEVPHRIYLEPGEYKLKILFFDDEAVIKDFLKEVDCQDEFMYEALSEGNDAIKARVEYRIKACVEDNLSIRFLEWGIVLGTLAGIGAILILALGKKTDGGAGAKNSYAGVGLALAVFGIFRLSVGFCCEFFGSRIFGEDIYEISNTVGYYGWAYVLTLYVFSFTCAFLMLQRVEKGEIIKHKMTGIQFLCCACMSMTLYVGSIFLTELFEKFILFPLGWKGEVSAQPNSILLDVLLGIICAPIFEELLCRKLLIDRLKRYGEGMAILVSGLFFGLIHGTVGQNFMATVCGMFWAYIYIRNGKIRYTIILHMFENTIVTILGILAMEVPDQIYYRLCEYFIYMLAIVGLIMWIVRFKKLYLVESPEQITEKKFRTVFGNFGMIITFSVCFFMLLTALCT